MLITPGRVRIPTLTFPQPWATLIVAGLRPHLFRDEAAPRLYSGERIAVHAAARPALVSQIASLMFRLRHNDKTTGLQPADAALAVIEPFYHRPFDLPLSAVLGTIVLGESFETSTTANLAGLRDLNHPWVWPLTNASPFATPVPARGRERAGFWFSWIEEDS